VWEGLGMTPHLMSGVPPYRLSFDGRDEQYAPQRRVSSGNGSAKAVGTLSADAAKSRWYGHGRMRRRFSWDSSDASSGPPGYRAASVRHQQYNAVHINAAADISAVILSGHGNLQALIKGLQADINVAMSSSFEPSSPLPNRVNTETLLAKQAAARALARVTSKTTGGVLKHAPSETPPLASLSEDGGWYAGGGGSPRSHVSFNTTKNKKVVQFTVSGRLLGCACDGWSDTGG
jgi:hypothetical protein